MASPVSRTGAQVQLADNDTLLLTNLKDCLADPSRIDYIARKFLYNQTKNYSIEKLVEKSAGYSVNGAVNFLSTSISYYQETQKNFAAYQELAKKAIRQEIKTIEARQELKNVLNDFREIEMDFNSKQSEIFRLTSTNEKANQDKINSLTTECEKLTTVLTILDIKKYIAELKMKLVLQEAKIEQNKLNNDTLVIEKEKIESEIDVLERKIPIIAELTDAKQKLAKLDAKQQKNFTEQDLIDAQFFAKKVKKLDESLKNINTQTAEYSTNDPAIISKDGRISENLLKAIEKHVKTEGIFRKEGSDITVKSLLENLENKPWIVLDGADVLTLTSAFKRMIKKQAIISGDVKTAYLNVGKGEGKDLVEELKQAFSKLSPEKRALLRNFFEVCELIVNYSDVNLMTASNLSVAVGTSLIEDTKSKKDMDLLDEASQAQNAFLVLFKNYQVILS